MEVYIFLTEAEYDCLFKVVPSVSISRTPLDRFGRLEELGYPTGSNVAVTCTDEQARDLAFYAEAHCKSAVEKICRALQEAGSKPAMRSDFTFAG